MKIWGVKKLIFVGCQPIQLTHLTIKARKYNTCFIHRALFTTHIFISIFDVGTRKKYFPPLRFFLLRDPKITGFVFPLQNLQNIVHRLLNYANFVSCYMLCLILF